MSKSVSSRRGRPRREPRLRVRTERRSDIDYEALARAVLEQAAMDDQAARANSAGGSEVPEDRDHECDGEVE